MRERGWKWIGPVLLATAMTEAGATAQPAPTVEQMLQSFADDYKSDPMAMTADFAIKVGPDWWHVSVRRKQEAVPRGRLTDHRFGPHEVTLRAGLPPKPTWYVELADKQVLEEIYSGRINAGSGAMQSFASDKVKVETGEMEGYAGGVKGDSERYHAMSHFFTKGIPEITYFGRDKSLPTHGVGAVSLYTMKGNRIAWFSMLKDEAANADPALEAGQVPNLFIITRGRGKAKLGNGEFDLKEGMSVFIAPFVKHVLWNPYDEPMEGILVLFGDNSDAAFGKSYLDLKEGLHDFYGAFPYRPAKP
jgi:mannose-6-phosphate isomerase-like protein (cupin superfamily)